MLKISAPTERIDGATISNNSIEKDNELQALAKRKEVQNIIM